MSSISQLFLYIPGIIIFLVGSGQARRWLSMHRGGACVDAQVISCKHVVKTDKKGREIYNYFNVVVEYTNPETSHKERQAIKSPTEYAQAQQVKMYRDKDNGTPVLVGVEDEALFNPWETMIGGALLIILALEENQGNEVPAMACLALLMAGAGAVMVYRYVSVKKRNLQPVKARIIEVYTRQISSETKIIRGSKFTYYPVVSYELDGHENIRRCNINSSNAKDFQKDEYMTLFVDPKTNGVVEKNARPSVMVLGTVLLVLGLLVGASILSVIL